MCVVEVFFFCSMFIFAASENDICVIIRDFKGNHHLSHTHKRHSLLISLQMFALQSQRAPHHYRNGCHRLRRCRLLRFIIHALFFLWNVSSRLLSAGNINQSWILNRKIITQYICHYSEWFCARTSYTVSNYKRMMKYAKKAVEIDTMRLSSTKQLHLCGVICVLPSVLFSFNTFFPYFSWFGLV